MMLPRETLAEEWDDAEMPAYSPARYGSVQAGGIEPRGSRIANNLMAAENPIVLTAYLGRKPGRSPNSNGWRGTCGIRVAEFNSIDLSISQASPCFAGFDPLPLLEPPISGCCSIPTCRSCRNMPSAPRRSNGSRSTSIP